MFLVDKIAQQNHTLTYIFTIQLRGQSSALSAAPRRLTPLCAYHFNKMGTVNLGMLSVNRRKTPRIQFWLIKTHPSPTVVAFASGARATQ